MAVLVAAGFERGTHQGLVTGNANNKYLDRTQGTLGTNVEVVAAAARTGSYGLRLTASAATVFCGFANNGNGGVLGTSSVIVKSFWFRIPSLPGSSAMVWSSFGVSGGADMALQFVQSTGTLNAVVGANTVTGPSISANTWYHVDLKADYSVDPHTFDWYLDGVAQTQVTGTHAAEQIFIAGWGLDNATQTITFHVDDVLMSITAADYPLGKHKVIQLVPDTGGTAAEIGTANATRRFTGNATADGSFSSSDILTAISEVPPLIGASATGVCQVTSGTGNAIGIPMTSYTLGSGETVGGLRIVVVGWAQSATAASIGLRTFNGTTETTLFSSADPNFDASTTAPAGLCKMATLANFDTQAELDALVVRLGYSADVSPIIGAHAIYAELAVKESAGVSGTAAGSFGFTASASGVARPLGVAATALGFTATAAGIDRALGVASAAFGFTASAAGLPAIRGAASASLGFTGAAAGVDRAVGAANATLGFAAASQGVPRVVATASTSISFTAAAAGVDRALGQAAGSFGFTATASGDTGNPPVTGLAAGAFGFTGTATGRPVVSAVAAGVFGFTATSAGIDRSIGQAVGSLGFTGSSTGIPRVVAVAVGAFGFTGSASGVPDVHGAAVALLGFTGTALGFPGTPPVTGAANGSFGFTAASQGQPRTPGVAVAVFTVTAAASGHPRIVGVAVASFGFAGSAAGVRSTRGTATGSFGFTGVIVGLAIPPVVYGTARAAVGAAATAKAGSMQTASASSAVMPVPTATGG